MTPEMEEFLRNDRLLKGHVSARLREQASGIHFPGGLGKREKSAAAVLFLMGMCRFGQNKTAEPCLIFNQRSKRVRQPGDLCFPGGGLSPCLDGVLAGLLRIPGLPLSRRTPWRRHHQEGPPPGLPRMLATGLRESFEEMRLNPLRTCFLGPLAPEYFQRFNRTIYPMVVWNHDQRHFVPNWEVERIVTIPLRRFLDPGAYARIRPSQLFSIKKKTGAMSTEDFPCLTYKNGENRELLWGLTYRIVIRFLKIVFDFSPPKRPRLTNDTESISLR
jgi:hypothetical protein